MSPTMNDQWQNDLADKVRSVPTSEENIIGAAETVGRTLGEKAKASNLPRDRVLDGFRQGIDTNYPGTR